MDIQILAKEDNLVNKKFCIVEAYGKYHSVTMVKATDEDLNEVGIDMGQYTIYNDCKLSLYTTSTYVGEEHITDMEIGDILEYDNMTTIIRLA